MNVVITGYDPSNGRISNEILNSANGLNYAASNSPGIGSVIRFFPQIEIKLSDTEVTAWNENGYISVNTKTFDEPQLSDSFDGGSAGVSRSFTRTLFHELFHGLTTPSLASMHAYDMPQAPGVNFAEAAAVFAENLIFAPYFNEKSRVGHVVYRYPTRDGNVANMTGTNDISGVKAFSWLTSTIGPVITKTDNGIQFSIISDDQSQSIYKTYRPSAIDYAGQIDILAHDDSGFLNISSNGIATGSGWNSVTGSIMNGVGTPSLLAILSDTFLGNPLTSQWRGSRSTVMGWAADRFYDREAGDGNLPREKVRTYDFSGTTYKIIDGNGVFKGNGGPSIATVSADSMQEGVVIVGAGSANSEAGSEDNILGGNGNDVILGFSRHTGSTLSGRSGNDVLLGSGMIGDVISGGADDDLLIARGLGAFYDGGEGIGDTLSYHHFKNSGPITVDFGFRSVGTRFGTDNFANIEKIIGTGESDFFNLVDEHPIIYAGDGGDTFRGQFSSAIYGGNGIDVLDYEGESPIIGFTPWALADSIEVIRGSNGDDVIMNGGSPIFKNTGSNPLSIFGNAGNDKIELNGAIAVDAGDDNDTVFFIQGGAARLHGGTGIDTLDFTGTIGSRLIVAIEGDRGTFQVDDGVTLRFTSFEKFVFGGMTLHLNAAGTFTGGVGRNSIYGSDGVDDITVGGTGGFVYAGGGDDVIHSSGLEYVYGEAGNDRLYAGNSISGHLSGAMKPGGAAPWYNDGDDYLVGGSQVDFLDGGTGTNELHGGGGYDEFFSNGYGENYFYGEADGGCVRYGFAARGGYPEDPDLATIRDMGAYFEVRTTSDRGQSYHVDHLYDIDKVVFNDRTYMLTPGMSLDTGLFM